jgi:hypothetical protein
MTYEFTCKHCGATEDVEFPVGAVGDPVCSVCGRLLTRVFGRVAVRTVGGTRGAGSALGEHHTPERDRLHEDYTAGRTPYAPGELVF